MTIRLRHAIGGLVAAGALTIAAVAPAMASPANAPTSLKGNFFNCSNHESGTFVTNSGNTHALTTWNSAHLTFSSGGTGVFIPTALALSVNGIPETPVSKGSAHGSVTCSISATQPGFALTGTVTGNIVTTG
jgi:hypothetical protein